MILTGILSHNVERVWPMVWPFLERSLERLDSPPPEADVLASLKAAKRQLWVVWHPEHDTCEGAVVTEIRKWPDTEDGHPVCHVWCAGGRGFRRFVKPGMDLLRAWAKAHGCAMLVHGGRSGWSRLTGTTLIGRPGGYPVFGCPTA